MSTHYSIFLHSDYRFPENVFGRLLTIAGISMTGGDYSIVGLVNVTCERLSQSHREVMLEEYGIYGLDVNWEIRGTYDKATDIFNVIELLYRCAAIFVNSYPKANLSLMRNGESFLLFNTLEQLILSPIYTDSISVIKSIFEKPFIVREILY